MPKPKSGAPQGKTDISLRMFNESLDMLDDLCKVNERSRQEIISVLVAEAYDEWEDNRDARINP